MLCPSELRARAELRYTDPVAQLVSKIVEVLKWADTRPGGINVGLYVAFRVGRSRSRARLWDAIICPAPQSALDNASHAARHARHGSSSNADAVALVAECSIQGYAARDMMAFTCHIA
jgi:hypothetical protein